MLINELLKPGFCGRIDTEILKEDIPVYADIKNSNQVVFFLNGSINRKIKQPPVFHRQSWIENIPFSSVIISDKSVEINKSLELAWYLGKPDGNYLRTVVSTVLKIRDALKLENKQIIFYGTSGGGYAGILLSSIIRGASCVAGNAQTDLSRFNHIFFNKFISDTGYEHSHQKINIMNYLKEKRYVPPITYLQNLQDENHFKSHYMPFLNWYSENRLSLNSNQPCEFIEYNKEGGHGGVPDISETIEHLNRISKRKFQNSDELIANDRVANAISLDTFYDSIEIQATFDKVGEKLLVFITGNFMESDIDALIKTGWRLSKTVGYYKYLTSTDKINSYNVEFPRMLKEYECGIIRWASKSEIKVKIVNCQISN